MAYAKAKYNFSKEKKGIFQEYDSRWVQFLIELLKPYSIFRNLLEREYGKNLDGVGAVCDLSYKDQIRLQSIVKIFEERLQCIEILVNRGESTQSIQSRFMHKSEDQIAQMVKNVLKEDRKETTLVFQTRNAILKEYHLDRKTLEAAVELLEDGDDRILYKYTYKIGNNGMTKGELLQLLALNEIEYNKRLLQIQEKLPILIAQVKENEKKLKEDNRKMKKQEKKQKENKNISKRKKELQVATSFKENFSDCVYTDFYFNQVISYRKAVAPHKFMLLTEIYGKELDGKKSITYASNSKASIIEKEIETIRGLLQSKKFLNAHFLPETFLELFQTEENRGMLTLEDVIVRIDKSMSVCQLLQKIYGESFNEIRKEVSLTYTDKSNIVSFVKHKVKELDEIMTVSFKKYFLDNFSDISYTEFYLGQVLSYRKSKAPNAFALFTEIYGKNLEEALHLKTMNKEKISIIQYEIRCIRRLLETRKNLNGSYLPNTFLELFQTEENQDCIPVENVLQNKRKNVPVYMLLQTIYGENFDETKKEVALTKAQEKAIEKFVYTVLEEMKKEIQFPFADYFKDHFDLENVSEEAWQTCLTLQATHAKETYGRLEKIYGEGLKNQANKTNIPVTYCNKIRTFIHFLEKQLERIKNQRPKQEVYFWDVFIKDLDEVTAQWVRKRVKALLSLQQNTEGYVAAQLLFGDQLDEPRKKVSLTPSQSSHYKSLLYFLRQMLTNKTTIYDYFYTEEEKTQENLEQFHIILKSYQEEYPEQYNGFMALFDEDKYALVSRLSLEQKNLLFLAKAYVKEKLPTDSFMKLKDVNKKDGRKFYTFMEYFAQKEISIFEQEEIKKRVRYFIDTYISSDHSGYQVAQKLFGKNLEEERKQVVLVQKEKDDLKVFVSAIRQYLEKRKVEKIRPNYFKDVFTTYDTPIEEREWIEKELPIILESIPKDMKYYQAGEKLYGPALKQEKSHVKLSVLEGPRYSHLVKIVEDILKERKKKFFFEESRGSQEENYEEMDFMSIQSVLEKHFDVVEEVLQVEPYKTLMDTVTEIEQELIYLKLVQRKCPSLTDEKISRITNIPLKEIHSYEIMTKKDVLNSLNQYIKRKN